MKSRDTFGGLLSLLVAGLNAQADVVTDWNEAALNAIRAQNTSPPAASRNLAILHLAIYDAVNGIARTHEPYRAHAVGAPPASASREAAASTAAYQVMSALYPMLQTRHDTLYQSTLGAVPDRPQKTQGVRWGEKAAAATSGHSTFSGAAAATMALFFGTDDIAFTVGSDDLPGVQRSYQSFSAAAEESGMSRILGGIHYMFSNRHGLDSGATIGEMVVTRYLRPKGNLSRHR